jgi:hypothetical protein
VFRHVQKTGGSTLRNFFRKQEATGDWEFYRCARQASSPRRTLNPVAALRSPQGDRSWPEVTNRKRLELLLSFWEARAVAVVEQACALSLRCALRHSSRLRATSRARRGA